MVYYYKCALELGAVVYICVDDTRAYIAPVHELRHSIHSAQPTTPS